VNRGMVEGIDFSGEKQTHKRRNAGLILFQKCTWEQPAKKKKKKKNSTRLPLFLVEARIGTNKVTVTQHVCRLINQLL